MLFPDSQPALQVRPDPLSGLRQRATGHVLLPDKAILRIFPTRGRSWPGTMGCTPTPTGGRSGWRTWRLRRSGSSRHVSPSERKIFLCYRIRAKALAYGRTLAFL